MNDVAVGWTGMPLNKPPPLNISEGEGHNLHNLHNKIQRRSAVAMWLRKYFLLLLVGDVRRGVQLLSCDCNISDTLNKVAMQH